MVNFSFEIIAFPACPPVFFGFHARFYVSITRALTSRERTLPILPGIDTTNSLKGFAMWYPGIDEKTYLALINPQHIREARPCRGRDMAPPQPARPRLFAARDTRPATAAANAVARIFGGIYQVIRRGPHHSRHGEFPRM